MLQTIFLLFKYIFMKGGVDMMKLAMLWASRIINGANSYSEVPAKLKPYVKDILISEGLDDLIIE